MPRKSVLLYGLLTFTLILLGALFFAKKERNQDRDGEYTHEVFHEGQQSFDINFSYASSLDLSQLKNVQGHGLNIPALKDAKIQVKGELRSYRKGAGIILNLVDPEVTFGHDMVNVQELISDSFRFNLKPDGSIQSFAYNDEEPASSASFWLLLLSQVQIVKGAESSFKESDFQSTYLAQYTMSGNHLTKEKSQLEFNNTMIQLQSVEYSYEGTPKTTVKRLGSNRLSLDSTEVIVGKAENKEFYRNSVQMSLIEKSATLPSSQFPSWPANSKALAYEPGVLHTIASVSTQKSQYKNDLGEVTLDELVADLGKNFSREEELAFYKRLRAYIFLYPENTGKFRDELLQSPMDGLAMRTIAVALGRIGHSQAQDLLRETIEVRLQQGDPMDSLLMLLVQTEQPTTTTIQYITALQKNASSPLFDTAQLAYGQMLSQLNKFDPGQANVLLQNVLQTAHHDHDGVQKTLALLGNSEMPEGIPYVQERLTQGDKATKKSALDALRLMKSSEATSILMTYASAEDAELKEAALNSARWQPYSEAFGKLVSETLFAPQQAKSVKNACLGYVKQHYNEMKNPEELLNTYLSQETDTDLRQIARTLLETPN